MGAGARGRDRPHGFGGREQRLSAWRRGGRAVEADETFNTRGQDVGFVRVAERSVDDGVMSCAKALERMQWRSARGRTLTRQPRKGCGNFLWNISRTKESSGITWFGNGLFMHPQLSTGDRSTHLTLQVS